MKRFLALSFLFASSWTFAGSIDYLPVPVNNLVKHTYYSLSFNKTNEEPNWVYYVLTDSMVINSGQERSNKFEEDKMVDGGSAKPSDYTKSGYDRGHLCPAGDMAFNPVAMNESFLMSNITPQTPDFNRGIWKSLESDVRSWALKEHKLIIVTGPVFKDNKGTIGRDKVVVPGYFFKLIYDATGSPRLIAFLIPNEKTNRPLTDFAVTTDEVEKLTGYDFFSQLPDDQELKLESHVELAGWFDGYKTNEPLANQADEQSVNVRSDLSFCLILIGVLLLFILIIFLKSKKRR